MRSLGAIALGLTLCGAALEVFSCSDACPTPPTVTLTEPLPDGCADGSCLGCGWDLPPGPDAFRLPCVTDICNACADITGAIGGSCALVDAGSPPTVVCVPGYGPFACEL